MDIQLTKTKQFPTTKIVYAVFACSLLGSIFYLKNYMQSASNIIEADTLATAQVKKGAFEVAVRGLGTLALEKRQLVASSIAGQVVEVLVKPGDEVAHNDVLLRLENPALIQSLSQKKSLYKKVVAQHKAAQAELNAQLQEAKTALFDANLVHQADKMQWQAQATLLEKGNSTISKLDFQRSEFALKRSEKQVELQQARIDTFNAVIVAKHEAQLAEQESMLSEITQIEQNIAALNIKSPVSGQIQDVMIELGTQLSASSAVAVVADNTKLVAKINLAELDAPTVRVGQSAKIDTYNTVLDAQVKRVSPKVENGQVEVELSILSELPHEARNKLNIEGIIYTLEKENALYVAMPSDAIANTKNNVFVVENHLATKHRVLLGMRSVNYVEVISGLTENQTIVISDMKKFSQDQQILLR